MKCIIDYDCVLINVNDSFLKPSNFGNNNRLLHVPNWLSNQLGHLFYP